MDPNYKAFAIELMSGFSEEFGDVDGLDLQELAAKHGLLVREERVVPCGERMAPQPFATGSIGRVEVRQIVMWCGYEYGARLTKRERAKIRKLMNRFSWGR